MDIEILLLTLGGDVKHVLEVSRQLRDLKLRLVEGGGVEINGVRVVGKGTNSVVFLCRPAVGDVLLACKIRRRDSSRDSLATEGQLLHLANLVGVGPRLYTYSRDVVAYHYVDGVYFEKWWGGADSEEKRRVVGDLLTQAYRLDTAGVLHNELSRLNRHVLISGGSPVILDFESATLGSGKNVTQVVSGLMKFGLKPPVEALRRYKSCLCEEAFRQILTLCLNQI
ncbi:MAG: serine/threonine protein kinase [Pyrobaculum sp.]